MTMNSQKSEEKSWRIEETCYHSNSSGRSSANTDLKNSNSKFHKVKLKESEKREKYLHLARELKTTMKYQNDGDTNCINKMIYST